MFSEPEEATLVPRAQWSRVRLCLGSSGQGVLRREGGSLSAGAGVKGRGCKPGRESWGDELFHGVQATSCGPVGARLNAPQQRLSKCGGLCLLRAGQKCRASGPCPDWLIRNLGGAPGAVFEGPSMGS